MATIEASDGVALYVERAPERGFEPGSGLPILFSCAFSTTHEHWRPQVAPLVDAGHRVILWDFRGHGRSQSPRRQDAYSLAQVLDDLERVLEWALGDEPAVLAGLSFGGLASLHFAARHPRRVRALVLADSGPGFKNPEAAARWQVRCERTAEVLEARGLEAFVSGKAAATCIGRRPELPAARAAAAAVIAQDPRGLALFGRRVAGPAESVIDRLRAIEQPALVVVGEEDAAYRRAAEVMSAKLPNAQQRVIARAGHIVNIEETEAFNHALLEFLGGLAASSWAD